MGRHALLQGIFPNQISNHTSYVSCICRQFFTTSATWEAHLPSYLIFFWPTLIFMSSPPMDVLLYPFDSTYSVFFAYSYITMNSQTRANKLAILLGPWCWCHQAADEWLPPSAAFGSRQGSCHSGGEGPREQGMVMLPGGMLDVARTGGALSRSRL